MTPQQDVYNMVYDVCDELGTVYEKVPALDVPYPFIIMVGTQVLPNQNKSARFAEVYQRLRFYATDNQRGTLSELMTNVELACARKTESANYRVRLLNIDMRIDPERFENVDLYHGKMELKFEVFI